AIGNLSRKLLGPGGFVEKLDNMVDAQSPGSLMFKIVGVLDDIKSMTAAMKGQLDPQTQRTLMSKLHLVMDNVAATTASLRDELDAEQSAAAVARLHAVLESLQAALGEANALLGENRPVIGRTLAHMENISRAGDEHLVRLLESELDPQNPAALLGKLHAGLDSLNASLSNIVTITAEGRSILTSNRSAIERTLANLNRVSTELKLGISELLAEPWRVMYRPGAGERERMVVFNAARRFAEAATYLDEAATRLESASSGAAGASEQDVREILTALRRAFEQFESAEEALWKQLKG
ncbi:MAG: hypothetical protein D6744_00185, partial [Planctomycetota bacterium]